jgi:uroporphyrinogen III methyltransferase / synthase
MTAKKTPNSAKAEPTKKADVANKAPAKAAPAKAVPAKTVPAKAVKEPSKKEPAKKEPVKKATAAKTAASKPTPAEDVPEVVAPARKSATSKPTIGAVSFVAVGPGDPDLLTVRATRLIADAAVVIADTGAEVTAAAHIRPDARVVVLEDSATPAERIKPAIEAAKEGSQVVRLVRGDLSLEGGLGNEAAALSKANIAFELAPGVSEVTGVPIYAGFGLMAGKAREVRVIDANATDISWTELAATKATLVLLNAAEKLSAIAAALIEAGRDAATPVAITRNGTTVDQNSVVSSLEDIGVAAKASKHSGPGMVVIGEVVLQREKLNWFESKALIGWRVLIPRTQDNSGSLMNVLRGHGAVPLEVPTISVEPPRTPQQIDRAVHGLVSGRYEWIGFTSVNAVRAIREKLEEYGLDARSFAGLKVAAVGAPTVAALIEFGVRPDLVPADDSNTAALLEEWPPYDSLMDPINRVFLPRADIATDTLVAGLVELGWEVEDITAFRTVRAAPPAAEIREAIKTGGFDAVLFTSSSTVRNLVGIAGKPHHTTVVACIGPQTAKTAEEHGLRVDVLAEVSTPGALVDALAAHGEVLRTLALESGESGWRPSRRRVAPRRKVIE